MELLYNKPSRELYVCLIVTICKQQHVVIVCITNHISGLGLIPILHFNYNYIINNYNQ